MKFPAAKASLPPSGVLIVALLVLSPLAAHGISSGGSTPKLEPASACGCSSSQAASGSGAVSQFFPRPPPIFQNYDEQLGITFTQNFTSIEYNVTALEQVDPSLGTGPAYLVNGLTAAGYWYQVGVSWDWAPGVNPGTGLDMNYEVWDDLGDSVFPADDQGGLSAFSGPVNPGDIIELSLYFSGAGNVVMQANDTDTGASASATYSGEGSSYFIGLPGSVANSNGYFSGLMTEWYHGLPYFADEDPILYSDPASPLTSAWMWMDEFDASNSSLVFADATTAPVSLTPAGTFQEFSYNGTTEFADAYELATGALPQAGLSSSSVPLVMSFDISGGGEGYTAPVLHYTSGGELRAAILTGTPTLYFVDSGTRWNVSATLGGSGPTLRWETDQETTEVAAELSSSQLVYHFQEYVTFLYTVEGGGSGYSPPSVSYSTFGQNSSVATGVGIWADLGSDYQYQNPLPGSSGDERWFAVPEGSVTRTSQVDVTYYNEYLVTFDLSFKDTELLPAVSLVSSSAGMVYSTTAVQGANREWLDSGASYALPQSYVIQAGQRFFTNSTYSGEVTGSATLDLVYEHQFYEQIVASPTQAGTLSTGAGWYDSGTVLQLSVVASDGWQFEAWQGSGSDSVSGSQSDLSLTVGPGAPSNETAIFYAGVTIRAEGPSSVSYADGPVSGTVSGGSSKVVFVLPESTITLKQAPVPVFTSDLGWSGASNSTSPTVSIRVDAPTSIEASSDYNALGIVASLVLLAAIVVAATVLYRRKGTSSESPEGPAER